MKFLNTRMFILLVALAVVGLIGTDSAIEQNNAIAPEFIYYDYVDDSGELKGGKLKIYADDPQHSKYKGPERVFLESYPSYDVYTIIDNGPVGNRIDIVMLGDGYTEPNLGVYAGHVSDVIDGFFSDPPLDEYASYFNVHRVDVISTDSGVRHGYEAGCDDPYDPVTALEMSFCNVYDGNTMERYLLIGDTQAASGTRWI